MSTPWSRCRGARVRVNGPILCALSTDVVELTYASTHEQPRPRLPNDERVLGLTRLIITGVVLLPFVVGAVLVTVAMMLDDPWLNWIGWLR